MTARRLLSLLNGLGYHTMPADQADVVGMPLERPREPLPQSSKEDIKRFFGGAIRVTPSEEVSDG
jgi:hypothetical protein